MENDGGKKKGPPAKNHLSDICHCSNGNMPCTGTCDFYVECSRTLCLSVMCFAARYVNSRGPGNKQN